uniref:ATP synthase complex subunit 8 n=1 Tax=Sinopyrophorus schimmeli TaxID=2488820 RepID=A0A3G5FPR8_9COLE|nr:ATP synthase F0 subunit 8 [Elateridae sp. JWH-2018]
MPQMSPLLWINLFIFFIMVFLIFNSLNYFSFSYKPQTMAPSSTKKMINWKW